MNANSQGFTIAMEQGAIASAAQAQYESLRNMQQQTYGGAAVELLRNYSSLGQANLRPQASHKRPCELCGADAYGAAEVKDSDGSIQRVSMCGDCARDVA